MRHRRVSNGLLSRRQFLAAAGALTAIVPRAPTLRGAGISEGKRPIEQAFGREMKQFMTERGIPGVALAVLKDRRLVFQRGYGWADREQNLPVKTDSLFRIASISKPFTAVAILKLVEAGKLDLNAPAIELLGLESKASNAKSPDPRLKAVTVGHCLHHTAGWDRDASGDPMFRSVEIAQAMGVPAPATSETIIRYELAQPLDFDPGSRFAYSNFGYCLLGRIIDKISGLSYPEFVRQAILVPMGIRAMRLGASLESGRADKEVKYYTLDHRRGPSVFPKCPGPVPEPYGTFCLEAMDSHGGWLASAIDLARFAAALDAPEHNICLKAETLRTLYEPPAPPVSRNPDGSLAAAYYACGWNVRPKGNHGRANYWHNGSLPGTFTLLVRRFDGLSWVALFNQRSENSKLPDSAIDIALHRAADSVAEWPDIDLFNSL
jgi:CubicO group peptidase (beta-lactamase class C family)